MGPSVKTERKEEQSTSTRKPRFSENWVSFISGGIAGTTAKTTIAPLERVKILFQIRHHLYIFTGIGSTLVKISKNEGFWALWKGNIATVTRIFPYAAIQFMTYEKYKRFLIANLGLSHPNLINLACGSLAGMTSVIFTYPLDLIRVRLAISSQYSGMLDATKQIFVKEGGLRGLYRGLNPTLLGMIPYAGTNFMSYEFLKRKLSAFTNKSVDNLHVYERLVCGGIAGCLGQSVAYPLDVVRRQMQSHGFSGGHGHFHQSTWHGLKTIFLKDGLHGLFKGLSINFIKAGPATAISFTTYEYVKKALKSL
jgi:solute carrier family 25 protein 16